jgi:LysM repeat protein
MRSPFFNQGLQTLCLSSLAVLTLSSCANIAERENKQGHYDKYYGSPSDVTRFSDANGNSTHLTQGQGQLTGQQNLQLQANAPTRYVVQKGDTLWSIARKFITKPWYWPEIWDKNQKIKNPHLIYPGDVLTLHHVKNAKGKVVPTIRVERGIIGKPVSTIIPFLSFPKIMDKAEMERLPYIVGASESKQLIHDGSTIYIKQLNNPRVGERHMIYHPGREMIDPDTGRSLGYEMEFKGQARIERKGQITTAQVLSADQEIRPGDYIMDNTDNTRDLQMEIRIPRQKVRGKIMLLHDAEAISGQYMIAAINRGKNHKLQVGHVVGIYAEGDLVEDKYEKARMEAYRNSNFYKPQFNNQPKRMFDTEVELPPEHIANMVIYKTTPNLSYGLIIESDRAVRVGDQLGNPQ